MDAQGGGLVDGVLVGAEEEELPAVFLLPFADHAKDLVAGIFAAGVLQPVGEDGEDHLLRPFFLLQGFVTCACLADAPADGVEEGGHSARYIRVTRQRKYFADLFVTDQDLILMVELYERETGLLIALLLLFEKGVEPLDRLVTDRFHRAGAVEDKDDVCRRFFHGVYVFGNYLFGDFSVPGASGTYRIKAGSEYSMWFPIGLEAKLNYEVFLRKYRNAYRRKRCGETTVNWRGRPCHLEDARMEGGERHSIVGGWHASSDVRKIMRILQPALYGLVEMKRVVNPAWDGGDYSILDEIKWGNKYIHQMQLDSGAVVQHYYLWCGARDWSEGINRYTNNVIGDSDDRLLPEETLVVDMVSQSRFIRNQSTIYRQYKDTDPEYAKLCLKAAVRCYNYFEKTWPIVTDYETEFCARPYREKVTDLMPLAYGVRANLYIYLATGNREYESRAVEPVFLPQKCPDSLLFFQYICIGKGVEIELPCLSQIDCFLSAL